MSENDNFQLGPRNYMGVEVRIACVREDKLVDAMARLRDAIYVAFPVDFASDIEVDIFESAGLTYDEMLTTPQQESDLFELHRPEREAMHDD